MFNSAFTITYTIMAPVKQAQNAGKKKGGVADSKCEESAQAAAPHYATEQLPLPLLAKDAAALGRC